MSAMAAAAALAREAVPGCTQKSDCPPAAETLLFLAVRGQAPASSIRSVPALHASRFSASLNQLNL
jgi:hypothetical protein